MVLHDVAQRAHLLVELAAPLDADALRHRDLHLAHVVAIPDRLQERRSRSGSTGCSGSRPSRGSGRCDRSATRRTPRARPVELPGRLEIAPERLLQDHARVVGTARRAEPLHDGLEDRRRDGEVVHRALGTVECRQELLVRRRFAVVTVDVAQQLVELLESVLVVDAVAVLLDAGRAPACAGRRLSTVTTPPRSRGCRAGHASPSSRAPGRSSSARGRPTSRRTRTHRSAPTRSRRPRDHSVVPMVWSSFSSWPPNSLRMAESSLSAKSA